MTYWTQPVFNLYAFQPLCLYSMLSAKFFKLQCCGGEYMDPAVFVWRQLPYMERGGGERKYLSHDEQPCLHVKKSQGSPNGSFFLTTRSKMVINFFCWLKEPLGDPWVEGCPFGCLQGRSGVILFSNLPTTAACPWERRVYSTCNYLLLLIVAQETNKNKEIFCVVNPK